MALDNILHQRANQFLLLLFRIVDVTTQRSHYEVSIAIRSERVPERNMFLSGTTDIAMDFSETVAKEKPWTIKP